MTYNLLKKRIHFPTTSTIEKLVIISLPNSLKLKETIYFLFRILVSPLKIHRQQICCCFLTVSLQEAKKRYKYVSLISILISQNL